MRTTHLNDEPQTDNYIETGKGSSTAWIQDGSTTTYWKRSMRRREENNAIRGIRTSPSVVAKVIQSHTCIYMCIILYLSIVWHLWETVSRLLMWLHLNWSYYQYNQYNLLSWQLFVQFAIPSNAVVPCQTGIESRETLVWQFILFFLHNLFCVGRKYSLHTFNASLPTLAFQSPWIMSMSFLSTLSIMSWSWV